MCQDEHVKIFWIELFRSWKKSLLWAGPIITVFAWLNVYFSEQTDFPAAVLLYWLPFVLSADVLVTFFWWFFRRKS